MRVEVALLSSQWRIKDQIGVRTEEEEEEEGSGRDTENTQTFDSRQVNAGVLVNPNAVADDPKRALFECT